jgi:putative sterol carrier protein
VELLEQYFPNEGQKPVRAYCNVATFGDMLSIHHDCADGENDITALWFVCDEWEHDWRGELLLFDEQYDAQLAITPKPGRLCLFRGRLPHTGTAPSRLCYKPRLTLVCKFSPTDERIAGADSGPGTFTSVPGLMNYVAKKLEGMPTGHMKPVSFKFVATGDGGGTWLGEVTKDGAKISQDDRDADLTITTDVNTFLGVVNGKVNPKKAFIMRKIKARGNLEVALRLRELRDVITAIR